MFRAIMAFIGIAMASVNWLQAAKQEPSNPAPSPAASHRALLNRYCVTCHNERLKTAGLVLDKMDVGKVSENAETWEKVIRKLRTSGMPPAGLPRPEKAEYDSLATYLETALDRAVAVNPNPGRKGIHRLNRAEYANAIRELLALDFNGEALLHPVSKCRDSQSGKEKYGQSPRGFAGPALGLALAHHQSLITPCSTMVASRSAFCW